MNKTTTLALFSVLAAAIFTMGALFVYFSSEAHASAPPGLGATIASSTVESVGTTAGVIAGTSTIDCAARIISTQNSAVMLTFTQVVGDQPTGNNGVWQAASTTVAYDSGLYGCNAISAYSYVAQNIKVMLAH